MSFKERNTRMPKQHAFRHLSKLSKFYFEGPRVSRWASKILLLFLAYCYHYLKIYKSPLSLCFSYVKSMICDSQQWNTNGSSKSRIADLFLITKCKNFLGKTLNMMSFLKCQGFYLNQCHKTDSLFSLQIAIHKSSLSLLSISKSASFLHLNV